MNDEIREQLSAYLDGALPEGERLALESRLAASAELRRELEELRSVSKAVKDLPKEPLPDGFLTRFQARRARGAAPEKNWTFLPPEARPLVAALSCGVVSLMIWDKVAVHPELAPLHSTFEAKITGGADAPVPQIDVSGKVAGVGGSARDSADIKGIGLAGTVGEPIQRGERLPFVEKAETADAGAPSAAPAPAVAQLAVAAKRGSRASGRPYEADALTAGGARGAMTEEERSAKNEEMFGALENEKKKMGIARVLPKPDAEAVERAALLGESPEGAAAAPIVRAAAPTMLKKAGTAGPAAASPAFPSASQSAAGRLSPDAGLVFSDARSLASSWILLGLPGDPPATDFTAGRLVLIKPSATKILSVTPGKDAISVVYRSLLPNEASDPARDRIAPIPSEPKDVLIFDASAR